MTMHISPTKLTDYQNVKISKSKMVDSDYLENRQIAISQKPLADFYRATAMLSAVYAVVVCLCVCLCVRVSVCHTPVLYQNG